MLRVYDCVQADATNSMSVGGPDPASGDDTGPTPDDSDPNAAAVYEVCEARWPSDSQGFYNCVQAFKVNGQFVDPYGD